MEKQWRVPNLVKFVIAAVCLGLLAACAGGANAPPETGLPSEPVTLPPSATLTPVPSLTATPFITPSPTATSTPTPTSSLPLLEPLETLTADSPNEAFQDLIIFNSLWGPFANNWFEVPYHQTIYAFSPDGRRVGALAPEEFGAYLYFPPAPSEKPVVVEYGLEINHPAVQQIGLPPECYPSADATEKFSACSDFQFSPEGRYLGFFSGYPGCGRRIIILDTQTGEVVYRSLGDNNHGMALLDHGKVLIARGHCEGGDLFLWDLIYGTERELGTEGYFLWNSDETAFVVAVQYYGSLLLNSVWGFNFETNQLFMTVPEPIMIDDHPVWTPDKRYLLYQHRTFSSSSYEGYTYPTGFDQARRIILVDAQTGYQQVLLSDRAYDFHLGSDMYREAWYGDWIQVRRTAFTPEDFQYGEAFPRDDLYTCRIYGTNCPTPVENFALNWKTGELVPWDEMVQAGDVPGLEPREMPGPDRSQDPVVDFLRGWLYAGPDEDTLWLVREGTPILTAPDLESSPIYTHPEGLYAYYVGIDGETLWMVPAEGDPVLWVLNGQNYFYLPPLSESGAE